VIFNPSFPYRFTHMMIATYLTTSLVVAAAGARYLLQGRFRTEGLTMLRMGLGMLAVFAPIQAFVGDLHGLNTLKHQPAKLAAIEAHWQDEGPVPLVLFAWPDAQAERNVAELAIPGLGSIVLTHERGGRLKGLRDFPRDERPPVAAPFFAFRLMVGLGVLMIATGWLGVFLWWRGRLAESRRFLALLQHGWPVGFVTLIAGWVVTETGRQPWIVHGILRTADAVSPVTPAQVATSLALFVLVYFGVFSVGIRYIHRMIEKGPHGVAHAPEPLPNRPLAAAQAEEVP
jgi:cytochrome d ubiquinol oxidase subunit I